MSEEGLNPAQKFAWAVLVVAVVSLVGYAFWKKSKTPELDLSGQHGPNILVPGAGSDAPKPQDLAKIGLVKEFKLIDQDGKSIEAKDLRGDVWLATFIFTHCAGTCPMIVQQMSALNKEIADLPRVKLISFSMDPARDTPEVLTKYAIAQDAVSPRWKFLTGSKDEMYRLTRDEFKLVVDDKQGTPSEPIIHSSKIVLVDAEGFIRGRFDGIGIDGPSPSAIKQIADSVRKLQSTSSAKEGK